MTGANNIVPMTCMCRILIPSPIPSSMLRIGPGQGYINCSLIPRPSQRFHSCNRRKSWEQAWGYDEVTSCVLSPSVQLRVESGKPTAQLISYSRSDTNGPKLSSYHIAPVQVNLPGLGRWSIELGSSSSYVIHIFTECVTWNRAWR